MKRDRGDRGKAKKQAEKQAARCSELQGPIKK